MEKLTYWTYRWWKKSCTSWQVVYPKGSQGFIHPRCCKISSNSIAVLGIHVEFTGACCENLRGHDSRLSHRSPGLHPSHEERGTWEATLERWNSRKWKGWKPQNKNARASQKNSVINRFFTFYKSKYFYWNFFVSGVFFSGLVRHSPPQKKRHLQIWHSQGWQTPMLGPWALDPTGLKFCGPKF